MFRRPRSWSLRAPGDLDCHSCTSCAVVWGAAKSPPNAFSPFLWDWRRKHVTDCLRLCGLQMVFILPRRTYAGAERAVYFWMLTRGLNDRRIKCLERWWRIDSVRAYAGWTGPRARRRWQGCAWSLV